MKSQTRRDIEAKKTVPLFPSRGVPRGQRHQPAPDGPRACRRPPFRAASTESAVFTPEVCSGYRVQKQVASRDVAEARGVREQTYIVRRIGRLDSCAIKQESHSGHGLALAIAEGTHQLLKLGGALDLEKDLVVVVRHLDVEVLSAAAGRGIAGKTAVVVGHGVEFGIRYKLLVVCANPRGCGGVYKDRCW